MVTTTGTASVRESEQNVTRADEHVGQQPSETLGEPRCVDLDWFDEADVVRVTPRNRKQFEIQKDRAIDALRAESHRRLFEQQFSLLLDRLAEWLREHRDKVSQAILTLQDAALAFVVVRRAARCDDDVEDSLTNLDLEVANDPHFDLLRFTVLSLPYVSSAAIASFLDPRLTMKYHGR